MIDIEADYPMFEAWWHAHKATPPARAILPAAGILVSAHGEPAIAAWVYQDNSSGVAFLGWFVSNPCGAPITISRSLQVMLTAIDEFCISQDRVAIFCMSENRVIGRRLLRHGYEAAHTATEYCRVVPAKERSIPCPQSL